jgi:hypothetical protein
MSMFGNVDAVETGRSRVYPSLIVSIAELSYPKIGPVIGQPAPDTVGRPVSRCGRGSRVKPTHTLS